MTAAALALEDADAELDLLRSFFTREHVQGMKLAARPPYPEPMRRGLPPATIQAVGDLWTSILLADLRRNPPQPRVGTWK